MAELTKDRKEYLKEYQRTKLKRIPLEMSLDAHIALLQHIALYGKKKSVNGYIKESLSLVMEIEEAGLLEEVREMLDRKKLLERIADNEAKGE